MQRSKVSASNGLVDSKFESFLSLVTMRIAADQPPMYTLNCQAHEAYTLD